MNTNAVIPFDFEGNVVRSTVINDEAWFVATDLATALEYRDADKAIRYLDEEEKGTLNAGTPGGNQDLSIVNESGLYSMIFKSRKAAAKRFRKWVTSEVLPSIRRTGRYGADLHSHAHPHALPSALNEDAMVQLSVHQYSELLNKIIRKQDRIARLEHEPSSFLTRLQAIETARILFEETTLTDEQIARQMEKILDDYMPEWVAWQRRTQAGKKPTG